MNRPIARFWKCGAILLLFLRTAAAAGLVLVDREHPHAFRHPGGDHFFPMGDTAYCLIAQPTNVIARYLDVRREQGFNFVRAMAMTEGFWPFGGTPEAPNYALINEGALQKWDWVFDYAEARGMYLEMILWGYGVAGGEGLWASRTREDLWIQTLVKRFGRRTNLFLWNIANEFERFPDGRYQFQPSDVDWARSVAVRIRELDAVHPIGCHPSVWITDQDPPGQGPRPFARYRGFTQRRPQVVWPLWDGSAVNLNVTQSNEGVQPRIWGDLGGGRRGLAYSAIRWKGVDHPAEWTETGWNFDAAGLEDCLIEDGMHGRPVLNAEFGYQHEPGYELELNHATRQCHQPATVRRKAWKIAASGAYFAAGFESTAVRRFTEADVLNSRPAALRVLHDFFTALPFWRMRPVPVAAGNAIVIAEPDQVYVAYLPHGGTVALDLPALNESWSARWFNPRSGQYDPPLRTDSRNPFVAPDANDWTLLVRRGRDGGPGAGRR